MRAHIIKRGKIVNTIEIESLGTGMIDASIGGSIGDAYSSGVVTPKAKVTPPPKRISLDELTPVEGKKLIDFLETNTIVTPARANKLRGN